MNEMATCRFCRDNLMTHRQLIKYGVRHYAHPDCALAKLGAAFFDRLHPWQVRAFPYFTAKEFDLDKELVRRIENGDAGTTRNATAKAI